MPDFKMGNYATLRQIYLLYQHSLPWNVTIAADGLIEAIVPGEGTQASEPRPKTLARLQILTVVRAESSRARTGVWLIFRRQFATSCRDVVAEKCA